MPTSSKNDGVAFHEELVKLRRGRLIHTRRHYAIPTGALKYFDADVQDEGSWLHNNAERVHPIG